MEHFLTPVLGLVLWTLVMWFVMYWRRIPAMNKVTKDTQKFIEDASLWDQIPARVHWAADNYNHLHEQPVLFYALMFYLFLTEQGDGTAMGLAWAYVIIRILHSLIQITNNRVLVRFGLFALGSIVLMIMTGRAVLGLF